MRRGVAAALVLVVLSGCAASDPATDSPSDPPAASEDSLPPGFDEEPDGDVIPDSALSPADLTALLRLQATDPGTPDSCGPTDVSASIGGVDAAAGHRYGRVVLKNVSSRTCTLSGYPGIGARGQWGNTFQIAAEHRDFNPTTVAPALVTLGPGAEAFANIEWTGELAGAESEKASMLVIQLAQGQDPFGFPAVEPVTADSGDQSSQARPLDIGILTTVRIGPMQPAA